MGQYISRSWEYADGTFDDTPLQFGEIDGTQSFNVLVYVLDDHRLDVVVNFLTEGPNGMPMASNFQIQSLTLSGDYTAAPVPEPATLLLMGTGLAGGLLRLRKKTA